MRADGQILHGKVLRGFVYAAKQSLNVLRRAGLGCGVSDGAAAAIITTPEIARTFRDDYVLVKGIGLAVGAFGVWVC